LPLAGLAGNNPASCREKNAPTFQINKERNPKIERGGNL
jgi:hypothetical protein